MNTINYKEAQQNFVGVLQKATKENIIIDGIDGNKFILAVFQETTTQKNVDNLFEKVLANEHLLEIMQKCSDEAKKNGFTPNMLDDILKEDYE